MTRQTWMGVSLLAVACGGAEPAAPVTPQPAEPAVPTVAVAPTNDDVMVETSDEDDERYCDVACRQDGLCAIRDGACVALDHAHCRSSRSCEREGRCTAEEGVCVASSVTGEDACDRWIALVHECLPRLPPEVRPPLEEAIQTIINGRQDTPQGAQAFAAACETMLESFSQLPMCATTTP